MAGPHHEPAEPRIIKKKQVHHGGHGGAWKVAYADFVTAMMALFIVLWIMGQSQAIRQNVAQYFKNPGILPGATGVMETSDISGKIPTPGHSQELQTPTPIKPDMASDRGSLEEVKKRITEVIAQLPELGRLKDQILLEITDEGLRIELLDKENSHFFDIGSANLKSETKELLQHIAQELGKLPNRLIVEGHTDSRPYGSQNYTNWELSADRANAARRLMEGAKLRPGQVTSVRGYADRRLRNPQDPMDVQNRRVGIIVMFPDKSKTEPLKIPQVLENLTKPQEKPGATSPAAPSPSGSPGSRKSTPPAPPEKAPSPGAAHQSGVTKTSTPTPSPLEDKVREEVKHLLQPNQPSSPTPGTTSSRQGEPRERLGW